MTRTLLLSLFTLAFSSSVLAADLPAYVKLPPNAVIVPDTLVDEDYGEANMPIGDEMNVKQGHHVHARISVPGLDDSSHEKIWAPFRTALTGAGWTIAKYFDENPPTATLRYQRGGTDAWITLVLFGADDTELDVVELKPFTPTLTLKAPAAAPETVTAVQSFPYLTPAGVTLKSTSDDDGALYVRLKGDEEDTLISTATITKSYSKAERVSNLQFVLEYRNALQKAGWQIITESQSLTQSDAVIIAHYARGERDIWASLHFSGEMSVAIADISSNLAARLAKECHVPLYGVTFEFNKATLRPEAESTLQRVATALQPMTAAVEVQGHTDNVGGDDYNLKLSQARAESVRTWLGGHGVAAARLTAKGYGRNQPVADNGTDEGRAKNRRVELSVPACQVK